MSDRSDREIRREERKARMMVRVAKRTFKRRPGRVDRLAIAVMTKAVGGPAPVELPADLRHDD